METSCDNAGRKCQDFSQVLLEELAEIERRRGGTPVQGEMPAALHERYRQGREQGATTQPDRVGDFGRRDSYRHDRPGVFAGAGRVEPARQVRLFVDCVRRRLHRRLAGGLDKARGAALERRIAAETEPQGPRRSRRLLKKGLVVDDEPEPVYHLRAYSNYLAPSWDCSRPTRGHWWPSTSAICF